MQAETKDPWLELCQRAANEQDAEKLLAIVREINAALELKLRRLKQGDPPLVPDVSGLPRCFLCGKSVPLETCKTDENGNAIHEECYVLKMRLKPATSQDDIHS